MSEYFLFDPLGEYLRPPCRGYRLHQDRYRPLAVDADGSLWSAALGLALHARGEQLRLYDPARQRWLPTPQEETAARRAAEARAQVAEERASVEAGARRVAEERATVEAGTRRVAKSAPLSRPTRDRWRRRRWPGCGRCSVTAVSPLERLRWSPSDSRSGKLLPFYAFPPSNGTGLQRVAPTAHLTRTHPGQEGADPPPPYSTPSAGSPCQVGATTPGVGGNRRPSVS